MRGPLVPDVAHEGAGRSTSEGDHAGIARPASNLDRNNDDRVAALSQNEPSSARSATQRPNHYVRTVDLERLDVTVASQRLIERFGFRCDGRISRKGCIAQARSR